MLSIRLRRMGSKKKPFFRVVVIEARTAHDSSFVENVGTYHPRSRPAKVERRISIMAVAWASDRRKFFCKFA